MMPDLGKYADAVLGAYAASIVLLVLIVWLSWRKAVSVRKRLAEVEGRTDG
ncbi:heme exporter protein CcmD [Flavimaricola marinus]|uniref:Heme exporter protein D n=1 Tax=Flavimaricola marinus TaxID=1819565 RepID=A0A238LI53_9RHOB|nr:heme exporter protein CcmD [Flavimaricola marinus]SMY09075.1 Heme exporter protein D (CcmD) [Flavimaricola marinus]